MTQKKTDQKQSITNRLQLKKEKPYSQKTAPIKMIKHPITKIVIGGLVVYGLLISSTYFINGYASFIKATRNLKSARKG